MTLRLIVADPRPAARHALRDLVEGDWGWIVAAEASDGFEAVRLARQHAADVLLMDASVRDLDSLDELLEPCAETLVVRLLDLPQEHATTRGVAVLKGTPGDHVRAVIEDALARTGRRR